jgi:hypothetical protein
MNMFVKTRINLFINTFADCPVSFISPLSTRLSFEKASTFRTLLLILLLYILLGAAKKGGKAVGGTKKGKPGPRSKGK